MKLQIFFAVIISGGIILSLFSCGRILISDEKIPEQGIKKIVKAINENDNTQLKELFAKQIITDELEKEIEYLMQIFPCATICEMNQGLFIEETNDYGSICKKATYGYVIESNCQKYSFYIIEALHDTKNKQNEGIHSILINKIEDDESFTEWLKSQEFIPVGIYLYNID